MKRIINILESIRRYRESKQLTFLGKILFGFMGGVVWVMLIDSFGFKNVFAFFALSVFVLYSVYIIWLLAIEPYLNRKIDEYNRYENKLMNLKAQAHLERRRVIVEKYEKLVLSDMYDFNNGFRIDRQTGDIHFNIKDTEV